MKLGELVASEEAFTRLLNQELSIKTSYHLSKLATLVRVELKQYHEQRDALIKKLGKERDALPSEGIGKIFEVARENIEEFKKQMQELYTLDVTLGDKWLLTRELLGDIKISGNDLLTLAPLFEKEKD
jgi:hypothetical protein